MNVSELLATKVRQIVSITPEQEIRAALARLAEYNIGALVVLNDQGSLVGILSERDIVRKAVHDENVFTLTVHDVMTKDVVVGVPQDSVMTVAHTMTERHFRHLPVVDGGKIVGIISIGDVMKAQRDAYSGAIDTLETQIMAEAE